MHVKLIAFLVFFLISGLNANGAPQQSKMKAKSDQVSWMDASIGIVALSGLTRRGATLYERPVVYPLARLSLLDEMIAISWNEFSLKWPISSRLILSTGIERFTDDAFLSGLYGKQEAHRKSRDHSMETFAGLNFKANERLSLSTKLSRGIDGHSGFFAELGSSFHLHTFMATTAQPKVILMLDAQIGMGTKEHNNYLYGSQAVGGFSYYKFGLSSLFPELIPNTTPLIKLYHESILGSENRNGSLVSDKTSSWAAMLIVPYKLPI